MREMTEQLVFGVNQSSGLHLVNLSSRSRALASCISHALPFLAVSVHCSEVGGGGGSDGDGDGGDMDSDADADMLACLRDLKDSSSHHHPSSREDDNTAAEKAEEQSKNFALLLVEEYIAEDEAYMQVAGEKLKDNGKRICVMHCNTYTRVYVQYCMYVCGQNFILIPFLRSIRCVYGT